MNFVHLMKRVAIATLCVLSTANAQDKRFAFKGSAASSGGGITVVTAREKTGWTSNGTTAQDTLATVYRLDKANIRFIVTDADGDTLWFYPQNLHPFVLKDGSTILAAIDSTGRFALNPSTAGAAQRALVNIFGRATSDTLLMIVNDVAGSSDSSLYIRNLGVNTTNFSGSTIFSFTVGSGSNTFKVLHPTNQVDLGGKAYVYQQQGGLLVTNLAGYSAGDKSSLSFASYTGSALGKEVISEVVGGKDTTSASTNASGYLSFWTTRVTTPSEKARITSAGYFGLGTTAPQAVMAIRQQATTDTLFMVRNDKNSTLDSTAMVFADGSHQFGVTAGGTNAFSGTAEHDTVTVAGASVNDIYTVTIKGAAAPAAADLFAVEALATGFAVHRSAAGTSGLEYYWRRERR